MGSHENRRFRRRKSIFIGRFWRFWNICEFIGQRSTSVDSRGAQDRGAPSLGHALHPCRLLGTLLTWFSSPLGVFRSKKNHRKFHSVWTPFDIPFLRNSKTRK